MKHPVVLVEDDEDIREAILEALADTGIRALGAANGQEAIERIRASNQAGEPPCVILLDMMLPIMDGWQFRAAQLKDETLRSILVVVLTAHANAEQIARELRADGFLRKPIKLEALLCAVLPYCPRAC
jgi:CheY-like chemotaxis protein